MSRCAVPTDAKVTLSLRRVGRRRSVGGSILRIEPLKARRTRLKLLLSSYLDACEAVYDGERTGSERGSRDLARNAELWPRGSYKPLERCLDGLRVRFPMVYRETQRAYVLRDKDLLRDAAAVEHWWDRGGEEPDLSDRLAAMRAVFGFRLILNAMPANMFVPATISENAGYGAAESKQYARRVREA